MYIIAPMMAMIFMFITPFEFQFHNGPIKSKSVYDSVRS